MARNASLGRNLLLLALAFAGAAAAQQSAPSPLNNSGTISVDGKVMPYIVRHLPLSSFPQIPQAIRSELENRGCLVPQSYEAHQPENVVHGSLQQAGSADWAILCSVNGNVSLMVFFSSAPTQPYVLASAPETEHLQLNTTVGAYGFDWAIDLASPQRIHDAASGRKTRPATLDHDALADTLIEHRTVYHFFSNNAWTLLDLPER